MASLAPGIAPAFYPGDDARAYRDLLPELRAIQPEILHLHTAPGPVSEALVDEVRRDFPAIRLWFGIPANAFVRESGLEIAARYARRARQIGAEVFMLNCEGPSRQNLPGWKSGVGSPNLELSELEARAERLLSVVFAELGAAGPVLALTSHDMPGFHSLPWRAFLGEKSPVRLHCPQQYSAPPRSKLELSIPAPTSFGGAQARMRNSDEQWRNEVLKGRVRADLGPDSTTGGFQSYCQLHDLSLEAQCAHLDRTSIVPCWNLDRDAGKPRGAFPGCDATGLRGLRIMRGIFRAAGPGPGSIARFQASKGLKPDGIVGPKTLAALGL